MLLTVTTVLLVVAIVSIWANRQLLNADNWASTSTSLLQNTAIRTATANYLVDQLYANVDVASKIDDALPPRLAPLAAPIAGALRNAAVQGTELALSRPVVQNAWRTVNRAAALQLIAVVNGGTRKVSVNDGQVSLNLSVILNDVASRLGISADLGSKLPPSAASLVVLKSSQIKLVQDIGQGLSGLAIALYILVPLLFVATLLVAPAGRRRRTLMSVGISGVVAGLVVILFRSLIVTNVPNSLVKDASVKPAANAVVSIATTMLTQIAGAVILIGVVVVVCAWFAGPSRFAVPARRWLAPYVRAHPAAMYGAVAVILLIIFIWQPIPATGKPVGMLVFAVLAAVGTEILRRQMDREFPDPGSAAVPSDGAELGPPLVHN
ncbi:MAG TPA: hypothetical protein VGG07_25510 [Solirubrobacteraceae bacterium]